MEKKLGKIKSAYFGIGGYQDGMIGLFLNFEGKSSWGVGAMKCAWDSTLIKHSPSCKWTEEDRTKQYADIVRFISQTLADANVNSVEKLTVGMIFSSQQFLETMFLSGYCPFFY